MKEQGQDGVVTKEEKAMLATNGIVSTKRTLADFIAKNKQELYTKARNNTTYNKDGQAIITTDDDWYDDNVWDEKK